MGTEQLISTLHTCFIVFLIMSIVFIALSVALFFILDIRNVFNQITGRAVRKTVEQMELINSNTGRLRRVNKMAIGEMAPLSVTDDLLSNNVTEKLDDQAYTQNNMNDGSENTSMLEQDEGGQYTTLLNAGETSVLNGGYQQPETNANVQIGKFVVSKKVMFIHTKEIV